RLYTLRTDQGDLAAAERALEAGIRAHPGSAELSELLIARYQTRGAHRELAELLRRAFERSPDNLSMLGALVDAYRKTGGFGHARDAVSLALTRLPDNAELFHERGTLHETLGMTAEALSDFESAFTAGGAAHLQDYVQALKREA